MSRIIPAVLITAILLTGCGKKMSQVFHRDATLEVNEVAFDYLTGKIKIDYDGEKKISGVANLRIRQDSLIWVSLSPGLGIEVARILVSKDSISVIDNFNKKYTVMNYEKLSKKFNFSVDYKLVESVVLGNLILPYSKEKLKKDDEMFTYAQQHSNYLFKNSIGSQSMKLEKLEVQDTVSKSTIFVNYGGFEMVEDQVLPFKIFANIIKGTDNSSTKLNLEYSKAEIADKPLRFPFNVPRKYEHSEAN